MTSSPSSFSTIIVSLEKESRKNLIQHQHDNFNSILDLFDATTKIFLSVNKTRSMSRSIENLKQAVDTERELYANVRGQLDRESFQKSSVEKMSHQAVEWCEHWRRRASDNAQELQEMTEAKDIAHDAALFWKARCICATAALKQLTEGSHDFDYSSYGGNMASLLHEEVPVPPVTRSAYDMNNNISYPAQRGSSQTSKHYHHHSSHNKKDKKDKKDKKKDNKTMIAGSSPPVRTRHPDLFAHVEEGENFATNYLYHNTQKVHPSHKPSRF